MRDAPPPDTSGPRQDTHPERDTDLRTLSGTALRALAVHLRDEIESLRAEAETLRDTLTDTMAARDELASIYDDAPIGYLTLAPDGRILRANLTVVTLLGVPRYRLEGARLYRFLAPESRAAYFAHRRALLDGRESASCELRLLRADGTPLEVRLLTRRGTQAAVTGAQGCLNVAVVDVSEHRSVERRLRMLAGVFEAASESIAVTDSAGRIRSINPALEVQTGFRPGDLHGRSVMDLMSETERDRSSEALWRALAADGGWTGELSLRRKNGPAFLAAVSLCVMRDDQGHRIGCAAMFTDITERAQHQSRLYRLANYDALTGLANRSLFTERLAIARRQAHRTGRVMALLFVDLDGFKPINDALGHAVGDRVLRAVADRLTARIRENDTVARLGGDEFGIILSDLDRTHEAARVAQSIIDAIGETYVLEGRHLALSASIGIAGYPTDSESLIALQGYADTAMYEAKAAGGAVYRFYRGTGTDAGMMPHGPDELERALHHGEFRLFYQPILETASRRMVGVEALLRWNHPEHGLLPPEPAIRLAEAMGMMNRLGEWVVTTACRDAARWPVPPGAAPLFVSVNISERQLGRSKGDEHGLANLLRRQPDGCRRLVLELREGDATRALGDGGVALRALQALGVRVALDNFGHGEAALSLLRHRFFDPVKIDRSLIQGVETDAATADMVRGIIAMAHALNLRVVAEGVETPGQLDFLVKHACDLVQGNHLAPPAPDLDHELAAPPH